MNSSADRELRLTKMSELTKMTELTEITEMTKVDGNQQQQVI